MADADGAGVVYACTVIGSGSTTTAGLLATLVLTLASAGCSALHLFTYGGADASTDSTGTFTIDTNAAVQITAAADGSANGSGQGC